MAELVVEGGATLECLGCGLEVEVTLEEVTAINLGLRPQHCPKCEDDDWTFVSLSKNQKAAKWNYNFCGKVLIERGMATESNGGGRQPIPKQVQREVWRRDQGKCVECGSNENLEYDHIVPVSKGGSNTDRNIQLLCEKCNRSKGNRI